MKTIFRLLKSMIASPGRRRLLTTVFVLAMLTMVSAQTAIPLPSIQISPGGAAAKGGEVSSSLQILALLTVLSLAPALMMLTTAFTRIVIILSMTRTAIGAQNIPPTQVIVGLSLFLTFFVMGPTFSKINEAALQPYMKKTVSAEVALDRAQKPLREFMLKNTYKSDLKMFLDMRRETATADNVSMTSLIPAFVISELKTAFLIGFYIFVPFIIIDLIVASILMSMGMMMMPPAVVSLPAKLLVFILADGWSVIVRAILSGYI